MAKLAAVRLSANPACTAALAQRLLTCAVNTPMLLLTVSANAVLLPKLAAIFPRVFRPEGALPTKFAMLLASAVLFG